MIKKLFVFTVILGFVGFISWPSIRSQIVDDNDQISLAKVRALSNSMGSTAINWLDETSKKLQSTSQEVAREIETQTTELTESGSKIIKDISAEGSKVNQLTEQVSELVKGQFEDVTNIAPEYDPSTPGTDARARFSKLVPKDTMMTGSEGPSDGSKFKSEDKSVKRFSQALGFKPGTRSLTPNSRKKLDELILGLEKPSSASITVSGRTNNSGGSSKLSFKRVQSITNYLREKGVRAQALGLIPINTITTANDKKTETNSELFEIEVTY